MMLCRILRLILLGFFLICSYSYASAGEFGPLRGKIVDAETKEPIEGVVVLVEWRETHFFSASTFIDAQETLTDKEGNFHIPGIWVLNPLKRTSTNTNMTIYKSGYEAIETWTFRDWKQINPALPYVLKLEEDGNPVIILRTLTMEEWMKKGSPPDPPSEASLDKVMMMLKEIDKDRMERGLNTRGMWKGERYE